MSKLTDTQSQEFKLHHMVVDNRPVTIDAVAKKEAEIKWVKLKGDAVIPTKDELNAGFDICTTESSYVLMPHETHVFGTDLSYIIDNDHYLHLCERGSTGCVYGLALRSGE